jgi:putative spermidine/putrescine transport system substrate-binding protein
MAIGPGSNQAAFRNIATSRRSVLRGGAALFGGMALGGPLLSACTSDAGSGGGGGGGGGGDRVVVANWGGAIQDAEVKYIYEPFTKETGIEVVQSGPPSNAKVKAMVDSGNLEWDVAILGLASVYALGREYFEEFPDSVLNVEGVDPGFIDTHSVDYYVFSTNMAWNTDILGSKKLEGWADFWDTDAFPGERTLPGGEGTPPFLEAALIADGVALEDLYPLDIDRAFAKMEELKPHVPQWWGSGAQPGQMLVSKQVSAAGIWSGRIHTLQDEGASLDFTWNGGMYNPASYNVVAGAKNKEAAFKLVEYALQPETQARVWGNYPCGPTNALAYEQMDEEWASRLPTFPANAEQQFVIDQKWWGENNDAVLERWSEFLVS